MRPDSDRKRSRKQCAIHPVVNRRDGAAPHLVESLEPRLLLSAVTYTGTLNGSWNSAANWSTGMVPQAGDDVVIDQAGNIQVTLTGSVSANSVAITGDSLILQSVGLWLQPPVLPTMATSSSVRRV